MEKKLIKIMIEIWGCSKKNNYFWFNTHMSNEQIYNLNRLMVFFRCRPGCKNGHLDDGADAINLHFCQAQSQGPGINWYPLLGGSSQLVSG